MPLLPKYFDFIDAAEGIRKMQATYQMFSSDIAKGLLDGVQPDRLEEHPHDFLQSIEVSCPTQITF